jgi:molybdopterin converting factor small subunit
VKQVKTIMHVRVLVHGLLTAAVEDPDRWLDVALPAEADVEELVQALCQWLDSPLFDPRSCMATLGGTVVPMNHPLQEGDEVQLYHRFSGG